MSINPIQDVLEAVGLESITPPEVAVLTHMLSGETTHEPPRDKEPRELKVTRRPWARSWRTNSIAPAMRAT